MMMTKMRVRSLDAPPASETVSELALSFAIA